MTIKQFQKSLKSFLKSQRKDLDFITYQCSGEDDHDYTIILISEDTGFVKGTFSLREDLDFAYRVKTELSFNFELALVNFLNKTLEGEE